jgi:hypothetical protein
MGPITRGGETLERKSQCHQNIIIYTGGVQRHAVAHQKRFDDCAGVAVVHAAGGRGDARFIEETDAVYEKFSQPKRPSKRLPLELNNGTNQYCTENIDVVCFN